MERGWDGREYRDYEYAAGAVMMEVEGVVEANGDIHRGEYAGVNG